MPRMTACQAAAARDGREMDFSMPYDQVYHGDQDLLNRGENKCKIPGCVKDYKSIEKISARNTCLDKISGLDSLGKLEVLDLEGTRVSKIEGLDHNTKLERLDLSNTRVPVAECWAFEDTHPGVQVSCSEEK